MLLARRMQNAAAGAAAISFLDNFNRTNGALGSDWTRLSLNSNATIEVVSNTARTAGSTGNEAWYRFDKSVGTNDMIVEADITTPSSGTYYTGILARIADSGAYGYRFVINSGNVELCRDGNEGGSAYSGNGTNSTHLDLSPDPWYAAANTTYHMKLRVEDVQTGVRVRAWVDNTLLYDTIDTSASRHTTGTRGGIYTYVSPTSTTVQWDNFVISAATNEAALPTGETQSDEFSGAGLSSFWTEVDPLGDCSVSVGSGVLTITVPTRTGLDHDDWTSYRPVNRTCRIMQPVVDGDWTIETKILNTDTHTNKFGGFRIEADFNNYIRADWDGDGTDVRLYVAHFNGTTMSQQYNSNAVGNNAAQWMQITKSGTTYTVYTSTNGTSWTQRSQFTWTPTPKFVGLAGGSSSASVSYAPQFEYFRYSGTYPYHWDIVPIAPPDSFTGMTTWSRYLFDVWTAGVYYNDSATADDGDTYSWFIPMAKGTWKIAVAHWKDPSGGKFDVTLDGSTIASGVDFYSAGGDYGAIVTWSNITVAASGVYELKFTTNGKNASSTDYRFLIETISAYRTG